MPQGGTYTGNAIEYETCVLNATVCGLLSGTWTPTEEQGPGSYPLTVKVCDNGAPGLCDSETIAVTVHEVNSPPALDTVGDLGQQAHVQRHGYRSRPPGQRADLQPGGRPNRRQHHGRRRLRLDAYLKPDRGSHPHGEGLRQRCNTRRLGPALR